MAGQRKSKTVDFDAAEAEILRRLDVHTEYQSLGVVLAGKPRSSGVVECFAHGREDHKPSACILANGRYMDSGAGGESLSLWDFAATKAGKFPDWRAARQHYAEKVGVDLSAGKSAGGKGNRKSTDPADQIEFLPWNIGQERLAALWCRRFKPGASVEAIKLAGGRMGRYPMKVDDSGKKVQSGRDLFSVVCLPAYGERFLNADPVAWVLWNATGTTLPVWRGKDLPPDQVKMKSVGETRGTMMNSHALARLAEPDDPARPIDLVIKTAGPSDMLAVLAFIAASSPESLDKYLVVTNASSETGDVLTHQAHVLSGQRVFVVHDTDEAGEAGAAKWLAALHGVAEEVRKVRLPWPVTQKHGRDVRDFLNGVEWDFDLRKEGGAKAAGMAAEGVAAG